MDTTKEKNNILHVYSYSMDSDGHEFSCSIGISPTIKVNMDNFNFPIGIKRENTEDTCETIKKQPKWEKLSGKSYLMDTNDSCMNATKETPSTSNMKLQTGSLQEIPQSGESDDDDDLHKLNVKYMPQYKGYESYLEEISKLASVPILQSVSDDYIKNFKHFNERYYEDKYCIDFGVVEPGNCDTLIRIHTNKLLLIALGGGNSIIQNGRPIIHINFVINNVDRSNVILKGKKKKGSKTVGAWDNFCEGDDKVYNIRAGVPGSIIEINELIKSQPDLLRTDPKGLGFVAVFAPLGRPQEYENQVKKLGLLGEEEYFRYISTRPLTHSSFVTKVV
ncbi:hypothetical protein NQ317_005427 [Molorchus minor]|uniref:Protein Abitram n=1 Tax=Molorchus minor TaxID=1323400 RepID=A0ABQ9JJA4_9CUCU|nr:hypothetical protein NQ317_005427 [Molorchus minor]